MSYMEVTLLCVEDSSKFRFATIRETEPSEKEKIPSDFPRGSRLLEVLVSCKRESCGSCGSGEGLVPCDQSLRGLWFGLRIVTNCDREDFAKRTQFRYDSQLY